MSMQTGRRTDSERTSQRSVTVRSAVRIPENMHSQEQPPGTTAENAASEIVQPAELGSWGHGAARLSTPIVALDRRDRLARPGTAPTGCRAAGPGSAGRWRRAAEGTRPTGPGEPR